MSKGNQKIGLGKGLGALLKDSDPDLKKAPSAVVTNNDANASVGSVNMILVSQIEVNPFQPRTDFDQQALDELADSIKLQGLIQPITVRRLSHNKYQLISGERRFRASQIAGITELPAYIRTADDQQMLEMALIENIQRENLNAIEMALSFQRMIDECNLKQEELGDRVSKNRSTVTNYLRLLRLPPSVQAAIRDQKISMGHARAILSLEDIDKQILVLNEVLKNELSVRKTEELVRNSLNSKNKVSGSTQKPSKTGDNYQVKKIADKLTSKFGNKVEIKVQAGEKGFIHIPFLSNDDLSRILEIMG